MSYKVFQPDVTMLERGYHHVLQKMYRWKQLHAKLMAIEYKHYAAKWSSSQKDWAVPSGLDCTTSSNFFLGYALVSGGDGYDHDVSKTNLVKAAAGRAKFSNHFDDLQLAFPASAGDSQQILADLADDGASYRTKDLWPWGKMSWGTQTQVRCKCGLHVSPAVVLADPSKLPRVSIATVSLASGYPGSSGGVVLDDRRKLYWEYTMMLVFNVGGTLYVYHHVGDVAHRWRTLSAQAQAWADEGVAHNKLQDSLWIVWKLPDDCLSGRNPFFFLDDSLQGEWSPP